MVQQGILKAQPGLIYDTLFMPENLSSGFARAFCIPLGQYAGRAIKQLEHTNMLCAGMLPSPEKFLLKKISCAFRDDCGYINPTNRPWKGSLFFDKLMQTIVPRQELRRFADETLLIRMKEKPKELDFDELVPPRDSDGITVIDTQEYFSVGVFLDYPINVPLELIIALEGVHLIPVF